MTILGQEPAIKTEQDTTATRAEENQIRLTQDFTPLAFSILTFAIW